MADDDFDDYFDDDGTLDALDTTELQALEAQAIAATQQSQQQYVQHRGDEGLGLPPPRVWPGGNAKATPVVGQAGGRSTIANRQDHGQAQFSWQHQLHQQQDEPSRPPVTGGAGVYGAGIGAPRSYQQQRQPQTSQYLSTANRNQSSYAQHQQPRTLQQSYKPPTASQSYSNYKAPLSYSQQQRQNAGYPSATIVGSETGAMARTGTLGQRSHTTPVTTTLVPGKRALDTHTPVPPRRSVSGGQYQPSQPQQAADQPVEYQTEFEPHCQPEQYRQPTRESQIPQYQFNGSYIEEPTLPMATYHTAHTVQGHLQPQPVPQKPSSDYGDGDFEELEMAEELLDTAAPTLEDAHGATGKRDDAENAVPVIGQEDYGVVEMEDVDMELDGHVENAQGNEAERLALLEQQKALTEQLAQEKAALVAQLEAARTAELSKAGEVSIVRNNLLKATREHERIVASMKSHQAEEIARLKAEITDLQAKETRMDTELTFIRKDLEETNRRNALLERKTRDAGIGSAVRRASDNDGFPELMVVDAGRQRPRTPSLGSSKAKGRNFAFRDGFEDEEMVMTVGTGSPSGRKKGMRTPTKMGSKRKRSANESPIHLQLPLSHPRSVRMEDAQPVQQGEVIDVRTLDIMWGKGGDDRIEFFDAAMLHLDPISGERVFDIMSRYSFPSALDTTLSAFFFSKVTALQAKSAVGGSEFLQGVFEVLFNMWRRCINEVFYGALSPILELVRFALLWNLGESSYNVMDKAVGLATETLQAYVLPRHPAKNLRPMSQQQSPGQQIIPDLTLDHCHACMAILEGVALAAVGEEHTIRRFWRLTPADLPILLLSISQPITLSTPMATLLTTSLTPTSFGPSTTDTTIQRENELYLIDHITKLLVDSPRGVPFTKPQLLQLRLAILSFLGACTTIPVGLEVMQKSPYVLPRLVKRVGEEIDELYEWRSLLHPHSSSSSNTSSSATPNTGSEAKDRICFINGAVRVMYTVIMAGGEVAQERLAPTVTFQRHLVAMARVAMSSGVAQEEGIEEDVVEKAATVLGELLRPDEAEEIEGLFDVG